jgi:hypothetical protein
MNEVRTVHAFSSGVTEHLLRVTVTGLPKPAKVIMHPAQLCAISMLVFAAAETSVELRHASLDEIEAVRKLTKNYSLATVLDIPIEQDAEYPMSLIEFKDTEGKTVALLDGLAVPVGFAYV